MLVLIIYSVSGCAPVDAGLSATQAELPGPTEPGSPTAELIPVEEITNLPTHAQTATPMLQVVETSIQAAQEAEEQQPPTAPEPNLDSLFGEDPTFEQADLLVKQPGQYSQIVSPFRVIAYVVPGPDNRVQVRLLGEDGRTLAEKTVKVMEYLGLENGNMITDLEFEISSLAELGRIEFSVTDEFGRVKAYNSVDVILLSNGVHNRNYAPEVLERVIIQYPLENYMIEGNSLLVSGLVRTSSSQPLILTLTDETGRLIGEGSASVVLSDQQDFGLFIGEIPYQVDAPVWVRLSVLIPGTRIPGVEFIKTMELVISP
ncbi:MAG: hypothetical protein ABFS17_02265 [Chloroflexota bacterium]